MEQLCQIEMFGWLRVVQADRVIARFRTRKAGALLAYVAYYGHRSHPREQLIELLWPESAPRAGSTRLRTELVSLRHQLEPPGVPHGAVLLADRNAVQLNPEAVTTDVAAFEAGLRAAERTASASERAQQLMAVAELYRGELLPGYFEEWILPERQRLAEAFLQALHTLIAVLEELGDRRRALQWARRAVAADPLSPESHQDLIRLLIAAGQFEAARSQFEQGQQLLEQELGVGLPFEIHAAIKELALTKDRPPPVQAGGRHAKRGARDQNRNPELLAVGTETSPASEHGAAALPQPGTSPRPSDNLPPRFTRFFGREREIEQLHTLLLDPETRLVTLTGPGGTGKTRLALQTAQRLRDATAGGVWLSPCWISPTRR
jgi:DNA-binding SARP family transcriptional activator